MVQDKRSARQKRFWVLSGLVATLLSCSVAATSSTRRLQAETSTDKGCGNTCSSCPNKPSCTSGAAKKGCFWLDNTKSCVQGCPTGSAAQSNGKCICEPGFVSVYGPSSNEAPCQACKSCGASQVIATQCTPYTDTTCACPPDVPTQPDGTCGCGSGFFLARSGSSSSCQACTVCPGPDVPCYTGVDVPCTATSDTVCGGVPDDGGCGSGRGCCAGGRCCSSFGYCGNGDAYCGGGCQRQYTYSTGPYGGPGCS